MSNSLDHFNWLARHYDFLSRLVYGSSLHQSQLYFLRSIPADTSILMIGGGTGEILKCLLEINATCRVWYVEASEQMLSRARKRISFENRHRVIFIHGTEKSPAVNTTSFDIIITNFFLDMFSDYGVLTIGRSFYSRLKKDGLWVVSDFVNEGKWWHRFLLWAMYRFFVLTCKIEAFTLPSWEKQLRTFGLEEIKVAFFYGGFIKSIVYKVK